MHGKEVYNFLGYDNGELQRQMRLQTWVMDRLHPIEDYLAIAVFGEAFVDPIANTIIPGQSYPAGDGQPGTLVATTAAPTLDSRSPNVWQSTIRI